VLLHAQLGLRYDEIARVLGISDSAARQRITRAKARFRRAYEKEGDHVEADHALLGR
jgi:DNA-directed RNA polymerase specialized sigma24 family protein